jgi:hypothetical protein
MKFSYPVDAATPDQLTMYADYCGWVLARAHASSAEAGNIAGYLGRGSRFDEAVADFAVAYADQNERDYAVFLAAISDGRLAALTDV